ncbi:MAG: cyclic nucleotide-binding domain-containing protein [Gammaproteobacteria bacterium]|nr:cyclic nucleotide-binding domain-containing protein [Gammaproteobacteria bacterium]
MLFLWRSPNPILDGWAPCFGSAAVPEKGEWCLLSGLPTGIVFVHKNMKKNIIDPLVLATLVPIKALGMNHCHELAEQSELHTAAGGDILFQAGTSVDSIFYILSGDVEFRVDQKPVRRLKGGSHLSKLPVEQGKVHQYTVVALNAVAYVAVDPDTLDLMLTWDQSGGYEVQELDGVGMEASDGDWMSRLLQAKVFRRIPPANIQSVFMRMEARHYRAGECVIRQGEEGEHFYIIREGQCQVTRKTRKNPGGIVLATLRVGDNFGEEALISGGKRNATIAMRTDGVLMSLSKSDFLELLNDPVLKWLTYAEARELANSGAVWIDVRLPTEHQACHIIKSINIPLPLLRAKLDKLEASRRFIIYCDTGRRSSIATYLLSQAGIDAYVLQDSLDMIPASEMEP